MQLHQLRYFVAMVKTGSITIAAEQCFISQPSISQQLANWMRPSEGNCSAE
jgi:LysR family hydrogen peroxide-inducible transcriptional activator